MNYTISTDTLNGIVAVDSLKDAIESSSITIALSNVTVLGDDLTINFKIGLSGTEITELNAIVAAHDGIPLEEDNTVHFVENLPQGGQRVTDRGFQFDVAAGTTVDYDFVVTEDLFVKEGFAIAYDYHRDDQVSMSIVHPLAGVLHYYLKDMPLDIHKADKTVGIVTASNKAITETNFNGLTIRMTYKSKGTANVAVKVTMRTYS